MTRHLVFLSQVEAQAAVELIDERGRACFAAAGYTITPDGAIVGKRDGVDDPTGVTSTWDVPRQRLDGRWVVTHPEEHPMQDYVLPSGDTVLAYVMAEPLDAATIEDEAPGWWPVAEEDS